jgi:hypothetical protein
MLKIILSSAIVAFACSVFGAELTFDFSSLPLDSSPTNFVSKVGGEGKPGEWKIVADEVPSALAPLSPNAPKTSKRFVLGQLAKETTEEHFPMFIFSPESFGDFALTTRFKCVSGSVDQMAGIAFRVQDEKNYYIVRASSSGNSFRFYKVINGVRGQPFGPQIEIPSGVWHEMSIECKGTQIRCLLDGKELIPALTDDSFSAGKFAFWTKSDSVSYFADTKITYIPRVPLAQTIVREIMKDNPRLLGLTISGKSNNGTDQLRVLASNDEKQIGEPGLKGEELVMTERKPFYAKTKKTVSTIMPLRDRNGETVAVVHITMKPFPGQTEANAFSRAIPIVKMIESRIVAAKDLSQ